MKKLFYATLAAVALSVSVGASVVGVESAKAATLSTQGQPWNHCNTGEIHINTHY